MRKTIPSVQFTLSEPIHIFHNSSFEWIVLFNSLFTNVLSWLMNLSQIENISSISPIKSLVLLRTLGANVTVLYNNWVCFITWTNSLYKLWTYSSVLFWIVGCAERRKQNQRRRAFGWDHWDACFPKRNRKNTKPHRIENRKTQCYFWRKRKTEREIG